METSVANGAPLSGFCSAAGHGTDPGWIAGPAPFPGGLEKTGQTRDRPPPGTRRLDDRPPRSCTGRAEPPEVWELKTGPFYKDLGRRSCRVHTQAFIASNPQDEQDGDRQIPESGHAAGAPRIATPVATDVKGPRFGSVARSRAVTAESLTSAPRRSSRLAAAARQMPAISAEITSSASAVEDDRARSASRAVDRSAISFVGNGRNADRTSGAAGLSASPARRR